MKNSVLPRGVGSNTGILKGEAGGETCRRNSPRPGKNSPFKIYATSARSALCALH